MLIMEAGSLSLSVFVCVRACVRVVAIAYLLQKTPHVFPIVGGRKVAHLRANIEALTLSLSRAQIARIEGVLPFDPGFPSTLIVRAPPFRSPKKVPLIAEFSVFFLPFGINSLLGARCPIIVGVVGGSQGDGTTKHWMVQLGAQTDKWPLPEPIRPAQKEEDTPSGQPSS